MITAKEATCISNIAGFYKEINREIKESAKKGNKSVIPYIFTHLEQRIEIAKELENLGFKVKYNPSSEPDVEMIEIFWE